jgi:hypothetical protein
MIELLRLVLPYIILLYFIAKGIKEPIFFLGIPFLIYMGASVFFDKVKIFTIPGSLYYALFFLWLVFFWIVSIIIRSKEKKEFDHIPKLNAMDYCVFGLILISFLGLGLTFLQFSNLNDVFKEFVVLISLFASYFIIKNWASNTDPNILSKFLYSLVIINSIAAFLYLLHQGLHIQIYKSDEYSAEIFQGEEITRSFWFMPQFLPFSIAYLLVFKEKRSFVFYALLSVNSLAVFISYTRSSLINVVMIFLLYTVLIGIKKGRMGLVIKNIIIYSMAGIIGFFIISKILPANTQYFVSRFNELSEVSATSGPNNLEYRFIMTGIIISNMNNDKKILGMGPVSENQISGVNQMKATTADMVWTGVIFRWGYIGLTLFVLIFVLSLISSFFFYIKSEGILSNLALFIFLYIFSQIIESFVSWTFMSGHGLATGLWYFAILSALLGFKENKVKDEEGILLTE